MSCLCVWLSAPNKYSIRTVFFADLLRPSLLTAASVSLLAHCQPAEFRGSYPRDKLSPHGEQDWQAGLHRLQHGSEAFLHLARRTETQTQTSPMKEIGMASWQYCHLQFALNWLASLLVRTKPSTSPSFLKDFNSPFYEHWQLLYQYTPFL